MARTTIDRPEPPPSARRRLITAALAAALLSTSVTLGTTGTAQAAPTPGAPVLTTTTNPDGTKGVAIGGVGRSSMRQARPIRLETYYFSSTPQIGSWGYSTVTSTATGFVGSAAVTPLPGVTVTVTDTWTVAGSVVTSQRSLTVAGSAYASFNSALVLETQAPANRSDVDYFVPGMIYGSPSGLEPDAIGGPQTYGPGYNGDVRIREDRVPGLLFAMRFPDRRSVALLNADPQGDTIAADGDDDLGDDFIADNRMRFGALGGQQPGDGVTRLGYWFPGTEGEVTYANNSEDGAQKRNRIRTHWYDNGVTQQYRLQWRFAADVGQDEFVKDTWRYAWALNAPAVNKYDIDVVRQALIDHLDEVIVTDGGRTAIPNLWDVKTGDELAWFYRASFLGFIGKNLENSEHLMREADRLQAEGATADATATRNKAYSIVSTFLTLDQSPPSAEGIKLNDGALIGYPDNNKVYIRPLTDDMNALLRAYEFEAANGRVNASWVAWAKDFADWLLARQATDGALPRAWVAGTGAIADPATTSSHLATSFLLRLTRITGDPRYATAGLAAAQYSWTQFLAEDRKFLGATPDHAGATDQEASALALDTYLDVYEYTGATVWLDRARQAADINESWYYLWDVPMPVDENDADLHIKRGVPTVGMELITTGQSFTGYYGVHNSLSFAKLYHYTGDTHYRDVARILMHNTRNMMALPGRTYDMAGVGWHSEFFNLSVPRGFGETRLYSGWTSAAGLHSIFLLEEFDADLYAEIADY